MIATSDILKLTRQLMPTGRAFKIPVGSTFEKLIKGLALSDVRAYNFALSTLDRLFPDNPNFTTADLIEWERRLGLPISPSGVTVTQRQLLVIRKYQFPSEFLNRQNYKYIEYQLQLAGFDVTVTENFDANLEIGEQIRHGDQSIHGDDVYHGQITVDIIANQETQGELFDIDTPKGVFIITGTVAPNLITSFRKTVLALKPVNTVALLSVSYIIDTGYLVTTDGRYLTTTDGRKIILVTNA